MYSSPMKLIRSIETVGGVSIYPKLKGGSQLLASLLTSLFYAMTKEVKDGRRQKEHRPRGWKTVKEHSAKSPNVAVRPKRTRILPKNPSSPGTKCPKVLFCGTICKIQKVFNPVVIPFNRTTGGNLIFIFLKGGFLLLASLLTGLFYAMSKKVNCGRRYREHQPQDQGAKAAWDKMSQRIIC